MGPVRKGVPGDPGGTTIWMTAAQLEQMEADAVSQAPLEACGLLAGYREGQAVHVVEVRPMTNALHSRVRFRLDPREQLAAFEQIEAAKLELVGIYHSHPNGPPHPSATDQSEAFYPEAVYLIWDGTNGEWACRAFQLTDDGFVPVIIEIVEGSSYRHTA